MRITRDMKLEKKFMDKVRNVMDKTREGIHISDLLRVRQTYFKFKYPKPNTDTDIMYFLTGECHEEALLGRLGAEHGKEKEYEGVRYTIDFRYPNKEDINELKTRRGAYASDGKELELYNSYIEQLRCYCACEYIQDGILSIWFLGGRGEPPMLRVYRVRFTGIELMQSRDWITHTKKLLEFAMLYSCPEELPLCEPWLCGDEVKTTTKAPKCKECDKEFKSEKVAMKHPNSKKGAGHTIVPGEYDREFTPRCKWYIECDPFKVGHKLQEEAEHLDRCDGGF